MILKKFYTNWTFFLLFISVWTKGTFPCFHWPIHFSYPEAYLSVFVLGAYVLSGVVYTVWFLLKNSSFSEFWFFSLHDILKRLDIEKPRAQIFKEAVVLICSALNMQSCIPKLPSTSLQWYPAASLGNMSWTISVVSSYVLRSHVSPVLAADKCNQGITLIYEA